MAAIANYTTRIVDPTLDAEQTQEALLFLDHVSTGLGFVSMPRDATNFLQFIGDIGQPLHVEAVAAGGNDIDARCSGEKTNLHAVSHSRSPQPCLPA